MQARVSKSVYTRAFVCMKTVGVNDNSQAFLKKNLLQILYLLLR